MFQFHFHNVTYLGEVDIFHTCFKNVFLLKCKNSKNQSSFSNVMTQMYCHLFMVHSVCAIHTIPIIVTQRCCISSIASNTLYVQKSGTYTAKSFQFLGALSPDPLTRGSAPGPRWGHSPRPHHLHPQYFAIPTTKPRASG